MKLRKSYKMSESLKIVIFAVIFIVVNCNECSKNEEKIASCTTIPTYGNNGHESDLCPLSFRTNLPPHGKFRTVATKKVMGRLGNHIWGVMIAVAMSLKFDIKVGMFEETKDYLRKYFKGFDECYSMEENFCGFDQFYDHFRNYLDAKIEEFYSEKAGHTVKFQREGTQLSVPAKYGHTWKLNYKELIDSQRFIDDYHPVRFATPECPFEWEVFRGEDSLFLEDDWKFNRALLLNPGISKSDDNALMASVPNFEDIFFSKLQFHDKFVEAADSVLRRVKAQHMAKQSKTGKTGKVKDFIFVGIHARGTDHIKYELDKGFVPLKTTYFLDAMHMFRQHFKKASKNHRLVFLYVSDEMEMGRIKLEPRNRDRDLYFVGDGTVDNVDAIGRDLAIMARCNHTIESHGSYSFFAGALAGGLRIVPQHFQDYVGTRETKLPDPFEHPLPRIFSRTPPNNVTVPVSA